VSQVVIVGRDFEGAVHRDTQHGNLVLQVGDDDYVEIGELDIAEEAVSVLHNDVLPFYKEREIPYQPFSQTMAKNFVARIPIQMRSTWN
jgi:hypothetical protein